MMEIIFNVLFKLQLDVLKDDNCNIELLIFEGYVFIKENNDNRKFLFNYDPNSKITKKFKYHRVTNDKIIFEKNKKDQINCWNNIFFCEKMELINVDNFQYLLFSYI